MKLSTSAKIHVEPTIYLCVRMAGVGESSDTVVEVNIMTLDSQVFSFQVDKNMPVSEFKEKIASEVGLPVGQQRLIFRGKVLKDDYALSEYHVDNGHTLHLVSRQPTESQAPSRTRPGEPSSNNGEDIIDSGFPARLGQISHSVLFGALSIGDQGEGIVPNISQVIGSVLSSIGLGNQAERSATESTNVMGVPQHTVQFSSPVQVPRGNQMEGLPSDTVIQSQAEFQAQPRQAFPSQFLPQASQIPMVQIPSPVPSLNEPVPHALRTLSEFMSGMEQALQLNDSHANESQTNSEDQPAFDLPTNAQGMPTPEALITVLRHAQRLLHDHIIGVLSHISDLLEQEGGSTDATVRHQIQRETLIPGLAIHHIGSLMLELGRNILALRMGQSPADAYVDSGAAVYITSDAPQPIVVQPSSSLFGESGTTSTFGNLGPAHFEAAPRQVNIQIAIGPRAIPNADWVQGGLSNRTGSDHSQTQHPSNVNAAAVHSQPSVIVPSASSTGVPVSQPQSQPGSDLISTLVTEINSQLQNLRSDDQAANLAIQDPSSSSGAGNDVANNQLRDLDGICDRELNSFLCTDKPDAEKQKVSLEGRQSWNNEISLADSKNIPPSSSNGGGNDLQSAELKLVPDSECGPLPSQGSNSTGTTVPLGVGLGGLEQKIDLQPVLQTTENQTPPEEIFRSLAATAAHLNDGGSDDLVNELCDEDDSANELMEVLQHDFRGRFQGEEGSSESR